jgi:hypothetical protein
MPVVLGAATSPLTDRRSVYHVHGNATASDNAESHRTKKRAILQQFKKCPSELGIIRYQAK